MDFNHSKWTPNGHQNHVKDTKSEIIIELRTELSLKCHSSVQIGDSLGKKKVAYCTVDFNNSKWTPNVHQNHVKDTKSERIIELRTELSRKPSTLGLTKQQTSRNVRQCLDNVTKGTRFPFIRQDRFVSVLTLGDL